MSPRSKDAVEQLQDARKEAKEQVKVEGLGVYGGLLVVGGSQFPPRGHVRAPLGFCQAVPISASTSGASPLRYRCSLAGRWALDGGRGRHCELATLNRSRALANHEAN